MSCQLKQHQQNDIEQFKINADMKIIITKAKNWSAFINIIKCTQSNIFNLLDSKAHLQGVNVMSNDDQLSLLLLHQSCDSVDTGPHHRRSLSWDVILTLHTLLGPQCQPHLALLLRLRSVLVHQTEHLAGYRHTALVRVQP